MRGRYRGEGSKYCWKFLHIARLLVYMLGFNVMYVYISWVSNYDGHSFSMKSPISVYSVNPNFNKYLTVEWELALLTLL